MLSGGAGVDTFLDKNSGEDDGDDDDHGKGSDKVDDADKGFLGSAAGPWSWTVAVASSQRSPELGTGAVVLLMTGPAWNLSAHLKLVSSVFRVFPEAGSGSIDKSANVESTEVARSGLILDVVKHAVLNSVCFKSSVRKCFFGLHDTSTQTEAPKVEGTFICWSRKAADRVLLDG